MTIAAASKSSYSLRTVSIACTWLVGLTFCVSLDAQQANFIVHPLYSTYEPGGIVSGPDDRLWFTGFNTGNVGSISTAGSLTEYPVPDGARAGIATGPDGNLWFVTVGNNIGRLTPTGVLTEFPVPTPGSGALGITTGPDGALWFTENLANQIGRVTTTGQFTEYPVPNTEPYSITSGPDGALWFTEFVGNIGRITTAGLVTEYAVPGSARYPGTGGITTGPDGALWFTESIRDAVGRITTDGVVTQYEYDAQVSGGGGITTGPGGDLWFTLGHSEIGRVTTAGVFTFYTTPMSTTYPVSIATSNSGAIWFTEHTTGPASAGIDEVVAADASLSVTPNEGDLGTTVTLAGGGFAPNEVVNVYAHSASANLLTTVNADSTGAFSTGTNIGVAFSGEDSLVGVGKSSGKIGIGQYLVDSVLTVTPTSGLAGTAASAYCSGLAPGYIINFYMGAQSLGSGQVNTAGDINFKFTVPSTLAPGLYPVTAHIGAKPVLEGSFTVN
jgi:virginiamycin B lyase